MPPANQLAAKLYQAAPPDTTFFVVYCDPVRREKSGRAKRITKWFAQRADAEAHQHSLNQRIEIEGTADLQFDAIRRTDATAAFQILQDAGHLDVTLAGLAREFIDRAGETATIAEPISPVLVAFLDEKEFIKGAAPATLLNLKNRLWPWIRRERISFVGEITRARIKSIRTRPHVSANSRHNDFGAVSSFCTWLFAKGKLAHHPVKGLRRPKVPVAQRRSTRPRSVTNCWRRRRNSTPASSWPPSRSCSLWAKPGRARSRTREFSTTATRPTASRTASCRANRTVNLGPAAVAWLKAAGSPETVKPLKSRAHNELMTHSGLRYTADVLRHTCISMRQQIEANDGAVARECGTSEGVIYLHYHRLVALAEARKWAALRPKKSAGTPPQSVKDQATITP